MASHRVKQKFVVRTLDAEQAFPEWLNLGLCLCHWDADLSDRGRRGALAGSEGAESEQQRRSSFMLPSSHVEEQQSPKNTDH
mmetsp:Transcript_75937/g.180556  ORF Transcript_75937/g.180556 Transcript_75937/m.180556 type:complete len:82 (-) Transcript_75937:72-317(-)